MGQDFRLSVTSDGEPLIYSHIFINGKYCCYSDTTGVAYIPLSKLSPGDTISASYIGMESSVVVYNAKLASEGRCQIGMKPNLTLDEITISYYNSMELFKKYVSFRNFPRNLYTYNAYVDYYSNLGTDNPAEYRGDISIVLNRTYDKKENSWTQFYKFYKSAPICDTINQRQIALKLLTILLSIPIPANVSHNRPVPKYLGEEEGQYIFALTFKRNIGWQYLLTVDKVSKNISEMEMTYPSDNYVNKMNVTLSDGYIKEVVYSIIGTQGQTMRIEAGNVSFDVKSAKDNYKSFKKDPKTWVWLRTTKMN